jgi:phage terminase large subunit-like protein
MFWTHEPQAPWQTPEWIAQMRSALRPNAFLRMIENRFVTSEETFVDMAQWDACVSTRPVVADASLSVWVGVDASVKRDSTAIAVVTWDREAKKARLVNHRIFTPTAANPINFEQDVEATILDLHRRFRVRAVSYDPYQMAASAQRLLKAGVPMVEFPQSMPNLTAASQNLYELIKGQGIAVYPDDEIRLAVQRAVAVEGSRGWKIAKEKASHKIDIVVALAQAALAAVQNGEQGWMLTGSYNPQIIGGGKNDGRIQWRRPGQPERPRLNIQTVMVKESDMAEHGLRTLAEPAFRPIWRKQ